LIELTKNDMYVIDLHVIIINHIVNLIVTDD